jgi:hypothetical protein
MHCESLFPAVLPEKNTPGLYRARQGDNLPHTFYVHCGSTARLVLRNCLKSMQTMGMAIILAHLCHLVNHCPVLVGDEHYHEGHSMHNVDARKPHNNL